MTDSEAATTAGVVVTVVHNKRSYEFRVENPAAETLAALRERVSAETGVPPALQKLMLRGKILRDDGAPIASLGVCERGAKILLVGSAIADVVAVNAKPSVSADEAAAAAAAQRDDSLGDGAQEKPPHSRVLAKGVPSDAMPGTRGRDEANVPPSPMHGMLNARGEHVRLSFKVYEQTLCIATAAQTERVPFGAVRRIVSEPIRGHEEYSIVAFQLGPTESSRYHVYWVPSQYVRAIRRLIL